MKQNIPKYVQKLSFLLPPKSVRAAAAVKSHCTQRSAVIAYPTAECSSENGSLTATKQALMKAFKPCDDGFQLVSVKKLHNQL